MAHIGERILELQMELIYDFLLVINTNLLQLTN